MVRRGEHAIGGVAGMGGFEELLTTDRSHEDHGTKLTNVVSKINELST